MANSLAVGVEADGKVLSVKENYSSFVNTKGGGETLYCHLMEMEIDGGGRINAQICIEQTRLELFGVEDTIRFKVTAFTKGNHTIKLLSVYNRVASDYETAKKALPAFTQLQQSGAKYSSIIGTDKELAMRYSIQYYSVRQENETDTVFTMADKILNWLNK